MKAHDHEYLYWDHKRRLITPGQLQNTPEDFLSTIIIAQPKLSYTVSQEAWKQQIHQLMVNLASVWGRNWDNNVMNPHAIKPSRESSASLSSSV